MRRYERAADREAREEANRQFEKAHPYFYRASAMQAELEDEGIDAEVYRNPTPEQIEILKKLEKQYGYMDARDR